MPNIKGKILTSLSKALPFNAGKWKVQLAVSVVLILLLVGMATRCHAASTMFGVGHTVIRGPTTAIDLSARWPDKIKDSDLSVGVTFIGRSTLRGVEQPANFAWRAELIDGFGRFDVGIGLAVLQNEDTYNSGRMNFTLSLAYRFKTLPGAVGVRHFSNGGTSSPNKGRDILWIGVNL